MPPCRCYYSVRDAPRQEHQAHHNHYDVINSNGRVLDGTGAAWFYGDIAIRQDRIARIAPRGVLSDAAALQRIDASGMVVAPDPDSARGLTHPRAYGNYTRILGKYVRDEGVLPLEDAIRKMSSAVATRLSIQDRGALKEGMFGDIVVFDPRTVADRATFEQPHQLSIGMQHVFVNGQAVVPDGKHTGALPGRIVRGPGYRLNRK
jgi:N-acyl-D-aspartate/D-glutamate deacylase